MWIFMLKAPFQPGQIFHSVPFPKEVTCYCDRQQLQETLKTLLKPQYYGQAIKRLDDEIDRMVKQRKQDNQNYNEDLPFIVLASHGAEMIARSISSVPGGAAYAKKIRGEIQVLAINLYILANIQKLVVLFYQSINYAKMTNSVMG